MALNIHDFFQVTNPGSTLFGSDDPVENKKDQK